jgi:hypothetical protein
VARGLPLQVVRRSGRIPKEIPIVLIGSDLGGKIFSEHTKTVVLSLHGAGIISRHKLSPEQELVLRWPERNKETEIRVVGQIGADSGRYTYGVAFFDELLNFWEMEFPLPSPIERELGLLTLFCSACQALEKIDDNSIEADVVATNEGVLRFCKRCGLSTVWKLAQPGTPLPEQPAIPRAAPKPTVPPSTPAPQSGAASASAYSAAPPPGLVSPEFHPAAPPAGAHLLRGPVKTPDSAKVSSPAPAPSVLTLPASAQKSAAPRVNRRKYPRVKVNYIALVRHPELGDEFVQCEDVSRGGLRFKSRNKYSEQALIEVAAPYSSGQPSIFVSARIVYVQELPEQNLYRYGAQYLNAIKSRSSF